MIDCQQLHQPTELINAAQSQVFLPRGIRGEMTPEPRGVVAHILCVTRASAWVWVHTVALYEPVQEVGFPTCIGHFPDPAISASPFVAGAPSRQYLVGRVHRNNV